MKNLKLLIAAIVVVICLGINACTKDSTNDNVSTVKSTMNVTLGGHTYHLSYSQADRSKGDTLMVTTNTVTNDSGKLVYESTLSIIDSNISLGFVAQKSKLSSPVDMYNITQCTIIKDKADSGKVYLFQSGVLEITAVNGNEIKGNFVLKCTNNSIYNDIVGDFDYK